MPSTSCERCKRTIPAKSGASLKIKFANARQGGTSLRLCNTCAKGAISWLGDAKEIAGTKAARTKKLSARAQKVAAARKALQLQAASTPQRVGRTAS
jgi:hypothetical protein